MRFFSHCESCKKRSFIIKKRKYFPKKVGTFITSQSELCRTCDKNIKKIVDQN